MKILFLAAWIFSFIQISILSQCKIEVIVISSLPSNQKVFITGNKPELGNWNPDKIPLNKMNDSTWSKIFEFRTGEVVEFKFTAGSWDEEALDEAGRCKGISAVGIVNDESELELSLIHI